MKTWYVDIETIPLPVEQRQQFVPTMETVKFGALKDPDKRMLRLQAEVADWQTGVEPNERTYAFQAQVCIVGVMDGAGHLGQVTLDDCTEAELLQRTWKTLEPVQGDWKDTRIVGFNTRFDASMLIHRSWLLGVKVPLCFWADMYQRNPEHWKDVRAVWELGEWPTKYISLEEMAAGFGVQLSPCAVTGATLGAAWAAGDKAGCLLHNNNDLVATKACWERMVGA